MIKKENGVTIVALVITIAVMIILASITIVASNNLNEKNKIKNIQTNMLLIQAKAEEIYNKKQYGDTENFPTTGEGEEPKPVFPGEAVDKDKEAYEKLSEKGLTEEEETAQEENIRHLTKDMDSGELGFKVDSDDYYVNYKTGEVYYEPGYDGKHLLSELKNY